MVHLQRVVSKITIKLILPCVIAVALLCLLIRAGEEIFRIVELRNESKGLDIKLEERKISSLELRRKEIVLGMEDFEKALLKANGKIPCEGEIRIRVK